MLFRRCSRFQRGVGGYAFLENGGTPLRFLGTAPSIFFLEKSDTPPTIFGNRSHVLGVCFLGDVLGSRGVS